MLCHLTGRRPGAILDLANYELELEDRFEGPVLDRRLWIPYYLPHWSSRARSAARYAVASGTLRLFIEHDQELWSPEFAGHLGLVAPDRCIRGTRRKCNRPTPL